MFYRYNTVTGKLGSYATLAEASDTGNPQPIFSSEEELGSSAISGPALVAIHNMFAPKSVNKFSDRAVAVRRTWAAINGQEIGPEEGVKAPEVKQEELPTNVPVSDVSVSDVSVSEPIRAKSGRGRKPGSGEFAGKRVFALKSVNPRRIGTAGFNSYEVIRGKQDGVAYSDYIAAGGRPNDLRWDIEHKTAEVK